MTRLKLSEVKSGAVRVLAFDGDAEAANRLTDLGLHLGARVEILKRSAEHGVLVAINEDGRVAVDAKTSECVVVVPLESTMDPLTLSALAPGDRARIVGLGASGVSYRQKIMAMGLTPGVEFEVTRVAPLGDPMEIRVRSFAMSLRRAEADVVVVEKL